MHPVARSLVQANMAVVILGGTTLFAKLISLPADAITFYRSVIGCIALAVYLHFRSMGFGLAGIKEYLLMSVVGVLLAVHWVTLFHAIQVASVAVGILSLYSFPVMTAILEPMVEGRRPPAGNLLRALMVFAGIALITTEIGPVQTIAPGVLWGLVSAALFSIRNIVVRKRLSHISGSLAMCYQMLIAGLLLLPLATSPAGLLLDNRLVLLCVLGIVFTALPHVLIVSSLQHLTATTFSLIACLHPLYSIVFAMPILSEIPAPRVVVGGAVIISMAVYENVRAGKSQ